MHPNDILFEEQAVAHRPNQEPRFEIREKLAVAIRNVVADQFLTHAEAAAIAQTPRTSLTAILNGNLDRVSLDRLLNIATRLGIAVHVSIDERQCPKS